jgi:hypothetical protein
LVTLSIPEVVEWCFCCPYALLGSSLPGVRLVTWTILAVVNWCTPPWGPPPRALGRRRRPLGTAVAAAVVVVDSLVVGVLPWPLLPPPPPPPPSRRAAAPHPRPSVRTRSRPPSRACHKCLRRVCVPRGRECCLRQVGPRRVSPLLPRFMTSFVWTQEKLQAGKIPVHLCDRLLAVQCCGTSRILVVVEPAVIYIDENRRSTQHKLVTAA